MMKLIDCVQMFNYILSDAGLLDQDQTIDAGGIDVELEITSGYWMVERFGRWASGQGERNCAKDIGVAEGNKP